MLDEGKTLPDVFGVGRRGRFNMDVLVLGSLRGFRVFKEGLERVERLRLVRLDGVLDQEDIADLEARLGCRKRQLQPGLAVGVAYDRVAEASQQGNPQDVNDLLRLEALEFLDAPLLLLRKRVHPAN